MEILLPSYDIALLGVACMYVVELEGDLPLTLLSQALQQ